MIVTVTPAGLSMLPLLGVTNQPILLTDYIKLVKKFGFYHQSSNVAATKIAACVVYIYILICQSIPENGEPNEFGLEHLNPSSKELPVPFCTSLLRG